MAVVARPLDDAVAPQQVDAAVAHMGPVNRITLHQGHRNRGARTLLDRHGLAEAVHGLVRMAERQVQEA